MAEVITAKWATLATEIAGHYDLNPQLLLAQIQVESSGDPYALRYEKAFFERYIKDKTQAVGFRYGPIAACSFGLLQILLESALEMGYADAPERLFTPRVGLAWGAKYLQKCIQRANGDYRLGLQHYNGSGSAAELYADKVYAQAGRADV